MRADLTYCDFLIFAPLQLEVDALKAALREAGWMEVAVVNNEFPSVVEATLVDASVGHFRRHVVIVQLNYQGVLNASVDTARALEFYEPGYVVSFGIAGTFNEKDAPIGSVIFATSLFYYEPSKDESKRQGKKMGRPSRGSRARLGGRRNGNTQSRMDPVIVGSELLNPFRNVTHENVTLVDGPWASGEKLFADIGSRDRDRILSANDKILGVEMEAAGVGKAVDRLCPSAEFVVIKGISDLADENKNRISQGKQRANRTTAASNAAFCLAHLMRKAPLRRAVRGIRRPSEAGLVQAAIQEAKQVSNILEPFGIRANFNELYACLYGRRGPIPAYYHWRQYSEALHWIDFKILTALRELPRDIVTPIPLVTIAAEELQANQSWYRSALKLLGGAPTTDRQIEAQREEMSAYINRIGFTSTAEQEIRRELESLQHTGRPEITLNLMRYMLGQFDHRRMFVFTWKSYRAKWENLSRAFGTWFSIFEWETLHLGGKGGKQEPPGKNLLIEPKSYASIREWLKNSPEVSVQEFVDHFKCHDHLCIGKQLGDSTARLNLLLQCWDEVFFS